MVAFKNVTVEHYLLKQVRKKEFWLVLIPNPCRAYHEQMLEKVAELSPNIYTTRMILFICGVINTWSKYEQVM